MQNDNNIIDAESAPAPQQCLGMPPQQTAVAHRPEQQVTVQSNDPGSLLRMAVERGADLAMISAIMDLQDRQDAKLAQRAFAAAKAAFKLENVLITKDKENKQYNSMYTTLGNLVATVTPYLGKHGLSADWKINQDNGIVVTCILSHSMGHSDQVTLKVPPDTAGAKNPIQQIKSAITYAKAVTFESVCGLASTDANFDDDGNGAAAAAEMRNDAKQRRNEPPAAPIIGKKGLQAAIDSILAGTYARASLEKDYRLTPEQVEHVNAVLGKKASA